MLPSYICQYDHLPNRPKARESGLRFFRNVNVPALSRALFAFGLDLKSIQFLPVML